MLHSRFFLLCFFSRVYFSRVDSLYNAKQIIYTNWGRRLAVWADNIRLYI